MLTIAISQWLNEILTLLRLRPLLAVCQSENSKITFHMTATCTIGAMGNEGYQNPPKDAIRNNTGGLPDQAQEAEA